MVELHETMIGFEVGGRVSGMKVARGESVAPGAIIATLDESLARPLRDARAAESQAAQAQLDLLLAGSRAEDVRGTAAQLRAAQATVAKIEKTLARQRELQQRGAGPAALVDDLESDLARAQEEVKVLSERLAALRGGARAQEIAAAQARVAAAVAALEAENERLARHTLRVAAGGTVVEVHVDPGETVAAGTAVVTLADTRHPYVDVFVPQARVTGIKVGTPASVRVDSEAGAFAGVVEDVGRKTEFTPRFLFSERERSNLVIRVRVRIDDPEERLHAGVPAFASFP